MSDFDDIYGKYTLDAPGTTIDIKDLNYALKNNKNYTENIKQNWGINTKIPNIEPDNKRALYLYHPNYNQQVTELKQFREQNPSGGGFTIFLEEINQTNNNVYIRSKILYHYKKNKIKYVVIFGSVEEVATIMIDLPSDWESRGTLNNNAVNAASDMYYGHMDNKEYKIIIGRLSPGDNKYGVSNNELSISQKQTNIQNQVDKIKTYEELCTTLSQEISLPSEHNWIKNIVGIASNEGAGYGFEGKSDNVYMRGELKNYSSELNCSCTELYQGSLALPSNRNTQYDYDDAGNPTITNLTTSINNGTSLLLYVGHANEITLSTTGISVRNVTNISPVKKYFLGCVVGCSIGSHDERFMSLAEEFQVSKDKGSIAMFASSILQSWTAPMYMQSQLNSTIINATKTLTIGEIFQKSVENSDFKNNVDYYYYQLLGDPCTRFILTIPDVKSKF